MKFRSFALLLGSAAMVSACGGGGGGGSSGGGTVVTNPGGGSTGGGNTGGGTGNTTCSLANRQAWVETQMKSWYLFPDLLATGVNAANYSTVQAFIDALVAPAVNAGKDKGFTYVTSIAEEEAYYNSGATAGFGFRITYDIANSKAFILEAFEGAPALAAGIDRGTEILAIGTSANDLTDVATLYAQGGAAAVSDALGPSTAGTTRAFRIRTAGSATTSVVTVTKADYSVDPVSGRYGAKIINDNGKKVGYINLRTFIGTAPDDLRSAFGTFKAQGVTELIIDLRYNGGGLVSVAETFGDLLGGARSTSDVFSYTRFNTMHNNENSTRNFQPEANAIAPTKIAFIGTGSTASASELTMNAMLPYLGNNIALIGENTYGKPVGQIGLDRSACDDRLRVMSFATYNADDQGEYFGGIGSLMPTTCRASDDYTAQLGDPSEASIAQALSWLNGNSCTPIASSKARAGFANPNFMGQALLPDNASTAQRENPGSF